MLVAATLVVYWQVHAHEFIGLDDNAYVWQSVQRFLGDVALPDTDEVVIKRRPAE